MASLTSPEEAELRHATTVAPGASGGTAVLLVNHGSHSPGWRRMLLDVHAEVADELLAIPGVCQVRTAFMEYSEPSIASQLRACDESGVENVVVVPLLLTISDHSFDDIPTICGVAADPDRIAQLRREKIEVHPAEAALSFAPLLDFSDLTRANLERRIRAIVGRYRRQPLVDAIDAVLGEAERAIVVPLLVAHDPMFQDRIIGRAVDRCAAPERVLYRRDAILPEPAVGRWAGDVCRRMVAPQAPSRVPG